jgi:hypothetical protein
VDWKHETQKWGNYEEAVIKLMWKSTAKLLKEKLSKNYRLLILLGYVTCKISENV